MFLYEEDGDHQRLTTDPTVHTPSSDGRLFRGFPYRTRILSRCYHPRPPPHVPQTPSQATAAQQHHQQLVAAAATTECSSDATDNGDTDLDAAAVEEVALGNGHTSHAHFI
jgi:hypothetical protein